MKNLVWLPAVASLVTSTVSGFAAEPSFRCTSAEHPEVTLTFTTTQDGGDVVSIPRDSLPAREEPVLYKGGRHQLWFGGPGVHVYIDEKALARGEKTNADVLIRELGAAKTWRYTCDCPTCE